MPSKEEERQYAEMLLKILDIDVELLDGQEPPDFYYLFGGRKIALETTRFQPFKVNNQGGMLPNEHQDYYKSIWGSIGGSLFKRQHEIESERNLFIRVKQKFDVVPKKRDIRELCNEIIEFVNSHLPGDEKQKYTEFGKAGILKDYLDFIVISNIDVGMHYFAIEFMPGGSMGSRPIDVIASIRKKRKKCKQLSSAYDKSILLIYDHTTVEAGSLVCCMKFFEDDEELEAEMEGSGFQEIYLLSCLIDGEEEALLLFPRVEIFNRGLE